MTEEELIALVVGALRAHPRAAVIVLALGAIITIVGNVWQALSKEKREAFKHRRPYVGAALEFVASLAPLVVRAARVAKHAGKPRESLIDAGGPGTVRGEVREAPSVPPVEVNLAPGAEPYADRSGPRSAGFVIFPVIGMVALGFVIAFALAGCPRLPAPDGCAANAVRCSPQGVPQLCDPQGRWTPMDDQCSRHGAACCVTRAYSARLIAVCLPQGEVCNGAQ